VRGPDNPAFARKFPQATLLYGSKHFVLATNLESRAIAALQFRPLANMKRRNSAGQVLKVHLDKARLLQQSRK